MKRNLKKDLYKISFSLPISGKKTNKWMSVCDVINQKRVRVFDRGFQTQMKARGRRPSAFIVSRCLETPVEHDARVFDMASKTIHTSFSN